MKIDDILAPWEYNPASQPKICEIHRFSITWNGEERPIIAALISGEKAESHRYLAFRLEGDDASWCFSDISSGRKESFLATFAPSTSNIEKRIEIAMRDNCLIRQFAFMWEENLKTESVVTLSTSGYGFWDDARFRIPVDNFFETKAQTLYKMLSDELENPDSDLIFSRQFSLLGPAPRRARLLGLKSENQLENYLSPLTAIWHLVLTSHDKDVNLYRQSNPPYRIANIEVRGHKSDEFSCKLNIKVQPKDKRLQFWADLLIKFGPIQLDYHTLEKYTALREFLQSHGYEVRAMFESPTAHECLEAKLQLLDWAKTHLPPEKYAEIEALES